jgi:RNA polymerase sigma-70 factor, ECF subfamily
MDPTPRKCLPNPVCGTYDLVMGSSLKRSQTLLRVVPRVADAEPGPVSDHEIIEAFERGESGYGELLYDRLIGVVEGTLYRMLGRYEPDHEDLVQSAFEQIVLTLASRRFARACSLKSWAAAVTCNLALNTLRTRGTERKVFDRQFDGASVAVTTPGVQDPEREAGVRRELHALRDTLARMSPKLAQTVVLHDALGHDLADIAVLTGVSVAAAQSRLVRGRSVLRRLATATVRRAEP